MRDMEGKEAKKSLNGSQPGRGRALSFLVGREGTDDLSLFAGSNSFLDTLRRQLLWAASSVRTSFFPRGLGRIEAIPPEEPLDKLEAFSLT